MYRPALSNARSQPDDLYFPSVFFTDGSSRSLAQFRGQELLGEGSNGGIVYFQTETTTHHEKTMKGNRAQRSQPRFVDFGEAAPHLFLGLVKLLSFHECNRKANPTVPRKIFPIPG